MNQPMVILKRNDITPELRKLMATLGADGKKKILRSMGATLLSITQGNFNASGAMYRPRPWPNKRDGTESRLKKSGLLSQSFFLKVDDAGATVGNPVPYARIHQFGGQTRPHKITAKNGQALKFGIGAGGGNFTGPQQTLFRRSVNHPGSKIPARPFFPVENGQLTPAALVKVEAAALRTAKKLFGLP